jgi:hypothetical protein
MVKICQSSVSQIVFIYAPMVEDENLYIELKKLGVVRERVHGVEIDKINRKMIVNIR